MHENPRGIGSDGESEEVSAGSHGDAPDGVMLGGGGGGVGGAGEAGGDDDAFSPVRLRNNRHRRFSEVSTTDAPWCQKPEARGSQPGVDSARLLQSLMVCLCVVG